VLKNSLLKAEPDDVNDLLYGLRYELRCVSDIEHVGSLLSWIGLHPASFRTAYPDRVVNNVYFDTIDLDCFAEHLAGVSERAKYRLRWYGDSFSPRQGVFEIKERHGLLGRKERYAVSLSASLDRLSFRRTRDEVLAQLPDAAATRFRSVSDPVLINRYRRQYFESFSRRVRITIDQQLQFYDQRQAQRPLTRFPQNTPNVVILECKFSAVDASETRRLLGGLPGRMSRCSKYILGVQCVLGY
jgi:hypothetical protein